MNKRRLYCRWRSRCRVCLFSANTRQQTRFCKQHAKVVV